ncbi:uncharacterized protein LOC114331191 [Diabrotica virgifera virgifera]|uniref:Uncharacterized protein LOC114331191 n=1 Tax=Diabrotica virgifera virgifera TaxID=50390 RepID=A0A6P7FKG7_DIAVI|nr:uncharacterized protein LOC114331191 [Diabrotica virgifera virgifera]
MKLNLPIVLVIFLGSVQLNEGFLLGYLWRKYRGCRPKCNNIIITDANVGAAKGCVTNIINNYRHPETFKEIVYEKVTTTAEKWKVNVVTRGLFSNFRHFVKPVYNTLSTVIAAILPAGKDVFDILAEVIIKIIEFFTGHNPPLMDLINKLAVVLASLARNAYSTAIKVILA